MYTCTQYIFMYYSVKKKTSSCERIRTGELSPSCPIYTNLVNRHGHFLINKKTCLVYRSTKGNMPFKEELESLAPDPIMWHGNGNMIVYKYILFPSHSAIYYSNIHIHTYIYIHREYFITHCILRGPLNYGCDDEKQSYVNYHYGFQVQERILFIPTPTTPCVVFWIRRT